MGKRGGYQVLRFCGWPTLERLIHKADRPDVKGLMATLFQTGCRLSECLRLEKDMFIVKDDFVEVLGVPVLKVGRRGKRIDKREMIRNIPIPLVEPLTATMLDYVDECKTDKLFKGGSRGGFLKGCKSRVWGYRQIQKVDPDWWPHRFRTERATQLVVERGFNVPKLMKYFNWKDANTPKTYIRLDIEDLKTDIRKTL